LNDISYNLTFEDRDVYLYACVEADSVSFEMIIEYTNKIVQELKSSHHNRLMLVNESPVLPSTDCYLIASYIVKNAISGQVRIAVVDTSPNNSGQQEQISRQSRAAGLDIQSFADVREAEVWLLEGNGKLHELGQAGGQ
jgi:hypothetical protein